MIGFHSWRADMTPWARSAPAGGPPPEVGIEQAFTGTSGNDTLDGTASDDTFDVSQGGRDIVNGLAGNDTFFFGKALTSGDEIDGGTGNDTVEIQGDSSVGSNYTVLFKDASLDSVENIVLNGGSGFSAYTIALVDACVASGATLNIMADSPGVTQDIFVDADFETNGHVNFTGGAGDDAMIVKNLKTADRLDGGAGSDFLTLHGDYSAGLVLNATTVLNFFEIDFGPGFSYNLTLDNATCAAGEVLQLNAQDLLATQTLTLNATAETDGQLFITGGRGNDTITLGASVTPPQVNLSFGGNDTVTGSTAADLFKMGGALTADDRLDGGGTAGTDDVVELNGDYSAGITLNATTIVNVETIRILAGHNYKLTVNDGNVAAGATLLVDAALLGAANTLTFTGSNEASGTLHVVGGLGNDVITTGDGNDLISLDKGGNDTATGGGGNDTFDMLAALTSADTLNGGAGDDTLQLTGDYSAGVTFLATTVTSIETLRFGAGFNYKLTWDNANGLAGRTVTVDATALTGTRFVNFNGAAELDGQFSVLGGSGADVVVGGALNDTLNGGSGNDNLSGSGGNDTIVAGLGIDTVNGGAGDDSFQFGTSLTAADTIVGDLGNDTLVLDGEYTITFGASSIASLEVIQLEAGHSYDLTFNNGNVAAGTRLTVDGTIDGAHSVSLDGSAELDGNFTFTGGSGGDELIGGALADILTGGAGDDVIGGGDGGDTLRGSGGSDTITGGGGADTFIYNNVGESTGPNRDTLIGFDANADKLDLTLAVAAIDAGITSGKLNSNKFNNNMQHLVRDTDLAANHAVVATPDTGDLAGKVFLIVDINGVAGYQSNADLVIQLDGAANLTGLDVSDFI